MDFNNSGSNRNDWDKWNSNSSHSSYYNQPTHSPHKGRGFEYASFICGLISITFTCTGFLSLPLGALGVLFALLTHRAGKRMSQISTAGIWLSGLGIGFSILMIVISLAMLPSQMKDAQMRSMINGIYEQFLGISFEDFMEENYGITFEH